MKNIIGTFEIPEDLAKRLTYLLTKKSIREQLLVQVIGDPAKYEAAEESLIPVVNEVDGLMAKITDEYVPEEFRSENYQWTYNGYEIDKNIIKVYEEV